MTAMHMVVAIIGMGPRGLSVLERLAVRVREAAERGESPTMRIYTVDPGEHGAGRVWRTDQPDELIMNTTAVEVSLYSGGPDAGPWRPGAGPSLYEWVHRRTGVGVPVDGYVSRRLYGRYLSEVYQSIRAHVPPGVVIVPITDRVRRLRRRPGGGYDLELDAGSTLRVEKAVLATGHPRVEPEKSERSFMAFADRHPGTRYLRGDAPAELALDRIPPGEPVAMTGLGLTFYDVLSLLTEGRGGRYERTAGGTLRYHVSGREPRLAASSRSGLPMLARGRNQKGPRHRYAPQFLTPAALSALRAGARAAGGSGQLRFREDVFPLLMRELDGVYYGTHVRRRDGEQAARTFAARYAAATDDDAVARLLAAEDLADLPPLALEARSRPFAGRRFTSPASFHRELTDLLRDDVAEARRGNVDGPLKAALDILRDVRSVLREAVEFGGLHPDSYRDEFLGWFAPINSMLSTGPPAFRVEQALAAIEAGVLTVVGPNVQVAADDDRGRFVLWSPNVDGSAILASTLIDARIPRPAVRRDSSSLTRALLADGIASAHVNVDPSGGSRFVTGALAVSKDPPFCVVDADGYPWHCLYALGIPTEELRWYTQIGNGRPGPMTGFHGDADAIVRHLLSPHSKGRAARITEHRVEPVRTA